MRTALTMTTQLNCCLNEEEDSPRPSRLSLGSHELESPVCSIAIGGYRPREIRLEVQSRLDILGWVVPGCDR